MRDIEEKFRKLAAIRQSQTDKFHQFWLSGDTTERREAEELLDIKLFQEVEKGYKEKVFLDPPETALCEGEYVLGSVMYPPGKEHCKFGLREDEWCKHVMIAGMTGMGKTNLSFGILKQVLEHGKPFLVFDWKRNYRDLLTVDGFEKLKVFTVGRDVAPFRFNPLLPPPGIKFGEWLGKLVDVIDHAYFAGAGVEDVLREAIDHVYELSGALAGVMTSPPTFYQVRDYVIRKRLEGRIGLWKSSTMRVCNSLCFRHGLGPVVNSDETWDYEDLLNRPVVIELDGLADRDKKFITEAMILWLYEYRKHLILIEEAHHILSAKRRLQREVKPFSKRAFVKSGNSVSPSFA
jgi:hypothetical protein